MHWPARHYPAEPRRDGCDDARNQANYLSLCFGLTNAESLNLWLVPTGRVSMLARGNHQQADNTARRLALTTEQCSKSLAIPALTLKLPYGTGSPALATHINSSPLRDTHVDDWNRPRKNVEFGRVTPTQRRD